MLRMLRAPYAVEYKSLHSEIAECLKVSWGLGIFITKQKQLTFECMSLLSHCFVTVGGKKLGPRTSYPSFPFSAAHIRK